MKKPEMIIFDYGHTLIYEPDFDRDRGNEAVLSHAVKNPYGYTAKQLSAFYHSYFKEISAAEYALDIELPALCTSRLVYESLGLEFDIPLTELERVFWDGAGPGSPMPHINELIEFINSAGLRSAVISNLSFCGENLAERINRLIPGNRFEFIMTSSDYAVRKPNTLLFQTALSKANISPDRVWYCGDNRRADVMGSAGAGIFPVWYDSGVDCQYRSERDEVEPDCEYLRIADWTELIEAIKGL